MPDTHLGYGIPVGGVAVTDDVIIQAGSGYDISCGVLYLRVPELTAADVADEDKRRRWIRAVEARVATGVGSHRPRHMPRFRESDVEEIFRYGAQALGVDADLCERQYIPIDEAALDPDRIGRARDKALPQLGSVGGGNHFIEMQVDRDDGSVWVMIHCGSRGYGWQTANHYFYAGAELRGLPKNRREESWLARRRAARARVLGAPQLGRELRRREPPRDRPRRAASARGRVLRDRRGVLRDLAQPRAAGDARAARRPHAARLRASQGRDARATRRPSRSRGHAVGERRAIRASCRARCCKAPRSCFRCEGAYASGCSVNHGAGRVMARGQAKRELAPLQDDIDREMRTITRTLGGVPIRGIVGNTEHTPLDECGHVYKNLDAVLRVLEDEGIARVAQRLYPVANIKGTD